MRRLYLQIYLTVLGSLVLFALLASIALWLSPLAGTQARIWEATSAMLGQLLPGPGRPRAELESALGLIARQLPGDVTLRSSKGELLAAVGDPLPAPDPHRTRSGFLFGRRHGATAAFHLPDGRWLIVRHAQETTGHLLVLATLLVAIAIGAYPVVKRLTGRLERLKARVDLLGAGDLAARVQVEGADEVASLAESFNRAAERIEKLVRAQRAVLAGASHELRSPLARLRVAIELLGGQRPELREAVAKDIAELDELIGELLVVSRLEAVPELAVHEDVDLLALVAEEASRAGAIVSGEPVQVQGDPRLLRRLARNLLENGKRYAAGSPVEASVFPLGDSGGAMLRVSDGGPGVAESERERIFEPFYRGPANAADGGVGLGLALVRQIARHHGGDARCLPREAGGTCFEVTFPKRC